MVFMHACICSRHGQIMINNILAPFDAQAAAVNLQRRLQGNPCAILKRTSMTCYTCLLWKSSTCFISRELFSDDPLWIDLLVPACA